MRTHYNDPNVHSARQTNNKPAPKPIHSMVTSKWVIGALVVALAVWQGNLKSLNLPGGFQADFSAQADHDARNSVKQDGGHGNEANIECGVDNHVEQHGFGNHATIGCSDNVSRAEQERQTKDMQAEAEKWTKDMNEKLFANWDTIVTDRTKTPR